MLRVALGKAATRQDLLRLLSGEAGCRRWASAVAVGTVPAAGPEARKVPQPRYADPSHLRRKGGPSGQVPSLARVPAKTAGAPGPELTLEALLERATEKPIKQRSLVDQVGLSQDIVAFLRQATEGMQPTTPSGRIPLEALLQLETVARQCYMSTFGPHDNSSRENDEGKSVVTRRSPRTTYSAITRAKLRQPYEAYLVYLAKLAQQQQLSKGKAVASEDDFDAIESLLSTLKQTLLDISALEVIIWNPSGKTDAARLDGGQGIAVSEAAESLRGLIALALSVSSSTGGTVGEPVTTILSGSSAAWDPLLQACLARSDLTSEIWTTTPARDTQSTISRALLQSPDHLVRFVKYLNTRSADTPGILIGLWQEVLTLRPQGGDSLKSVDSAHGDPLPWMADPVGFTDVAAAFLFKLLQQITTSASRQSTTDGSVQTCISSLLNAVPKPTPMPIYHALLAHHARGDASPSGSTSIRPHASRDDSLSKLQRTWLQMRAEGLSDLKAYHLYMEGVARKGDREALVRAWDELRSDRGCQERWEQQQALDDAERTPRLFPPVSTFNHLISLLLLLPQGQGADFALALFDFLAAPANTYAPDIITVNTVMRHYARNKDIDAMMRLVDRMPALGGSGNELKPDVVTYTTIIGGLLDAGQRDAVPQLLRAMDEVGIKPSVQTFSLLVSDLSRAGDRDSLERAEAMVEQMLQGGLTPTEVTWTSLIGGYLRGGFVADASKTIARMRHLGVKIDRVTYNMILRGVVRLPDGNVESARSLRRALGLGSMADRTRSSGVDVLQAMENDGIRPNEDSWYIILDSLIRRRQHEQASLVVREMRARSFSVTPNSALSRLVAKIGR